MVYREELIDEALRLPASAIPYYVFRQLATLFPDKALIACENSLFNNAWLTVTSQGEFFEYIRLEWMEGYSHQFARETMSLCEEFQK